MVNPILFGGDDLGLAATHAARTAAGAHSAAQGAQRGLDHLEDRLERLSLVCMAMWSLLQDKTDLKEQDLLDRVRTIDLMDGVEDAKATRTIQKCASCGRTMSPRHRKCLYCGAAKFTDSAFDAI